MPGRASARWQRWSERAVYAIGTKWILPEIEVRQLALHRCACASLYKQSATLGKIDDQAIVGEQAGPDEAECSTEGWLMGWQAVSSVDVGWFRAFWELQDTGRKILSCDVKFTAGFLT